MYSKMLRRCLIVALVVALSGCRYSGITQTDCGAPDCFPADPMVAVGPNHIIQTVNVAWRIWEKTKAAHVYHANLSDFMGGYMCPWQSEPADPRIRYDAVTGRFFLVFIETVRHNGIDPRICLGVSRTSNPFEGWYFYALTPPRERMPNGALHTVFPDYPGLGIGSFHLTITYQPFSIENGQLADVTRSPIYYIDKWQLMQGNPNAPLTWFGPPRAGNPRVYNLLQPAMQYDSTLPGPSNQVLVGNDVWDFKTRDLRIGLISGLPGHPAAALDTFNRSMPGHDMRTVAAVPAGTYVYLSANDHRILDVFARHGQLWAAWHQCFLYSDGFGNNFCEAGTRFARLNPSTKNVESQFEHRDGAGRNHYTYPAFAMTGDGTLWYVLNHSNWTTPVSVLLGRWYWGEGGPRPLLGAHVGTGTIFGGRLGDYNGVAPDPSVPGGAAFTGMMGERYNQNQHRWRADVGWVMRSMLGE